MSQVSGSVVECSLNGRIYAPSSDAAVKITLGGYKNEALPNGNGSAGMQKTAIPPGVEGLVIAIDHDKNDAQALQDVADGKDFVAFSITLADGNTYQGKVQIEETGFDTQKSQAELKLFANGKITKQ